MIFFLSILGKNLVYIDILTVLCLCLFFIIIYVIRLLSLSISRELTLVEYEVVYAIRSQEFLDTAWSTDQKHLHAPNLLRYIEWFNEVCIIGKKER